MDEEQMYTVLWRTYGMPKRDARSAVNEAAKNGAAVIPSLGRRGIIQIEPGYFALTRPNCNVSGLNAALARFGIIIEWKP